MRKIVLTMSMSLDGYSEGPDRDISWHRVDDEVHRHINAYLATMGGFLHGRVTHELMAGFWPTADADPASPEPVKEFAALWRGMPKTVYSRTLERADWNTTVVREVVPEEVRALKARPGGDLSLGGARLAASFMAHGLIDEFHIYVHPVLVGGGTRLFPDAGATAGLDLVESRTFGNGVVLLYYRRAGASGPE
ncbi:MULTISPECIES: dihydrofolate reductase family protein [unclassified Streptomyces]|uniref:dihydrofolate reductase family protein n=1 Tax=unclassified Streptomyces TaxID=2593676 RepID=UPI002024F1C0|nr:MULTISPECIES: dihydrofolate reductase family protein [unclassified Streptomyces]WSC19765.1 dihydrofolate reductase family protein [Streptomyces sp. NBC_01766]WSV53789.1 dihydrofolate reductase family protein [Streptomyces sp. NBC_01014]